MLVADLVYVIVHYLKSIVKPRNNITYKTKATFFFVVLARPNLIFGESI